LLCRHFFLENGEVVIESIFALPGIGRYLVDAINRRDYPIISSVNLVVATVVLVLNLIIDLTYASPKAGGCRLR
jgi:ABC-type dipeptide/oligopeptide/nickel transport system permease component